VIPLCTRNAVRDAGGVGPPGVRQNVIVPLGHASVDRVVE